MSDGKSWSENKNPSENKNLSKNKSLSKDRSQNSKKSGTWYKNIKKDSRNKSEKVAALGRDS